MEKNLVAKKSIAKFTYAPDIIKISFYLKQSLPLAPDSNFSAPDRSIEKINAISVNENTTPWGGREFEEKSFWSGLVNDVKTCFLGGERICIPAFVGQKIS